MYQVIALRPTEEQIQGFGMVESYDDTFVDFKIQLEALSSDQKQALGQLFKIPLERLEQESVLILSTLTGV